jgi:hypothetical protein
MANEITSRQADVQTAPDLRGPYVTQPNLYCRYAQRALAPQIDEARIVYHYGRIDGAAVDPLTGMVGQYVRIVDYVTNAPLWVGVIVSVADAPGYDDVTPAPGDQAFTALGPSYIFDSVAINRSYIRDAGGNAVEIGRGLDWNLTPTGFGPNRSADKLGGSYVFDASDDAAYWSDADIVEYLLARFAPPAWAVQMTGQTGNLGFARPHRPGRTLAATLSAIIDRRRGATWYIDALGGPIKLYVGSTLDDPIQIPGPGGPVQLAANSAQVVVDLDGAEPRSSVTIGESVSHGYDRIEVRGEPLLVVDTLEIGGAESLVTNWSPDLQAEYETASAAERADDKYRDVYTSFRMSETHEAVAPTVNDDGSIDPSTGRPLYRGDLTFESHLPLWSSWDYTVNPPEPAGPTVGQFLPALVVARRAAADDEYIHLTKPAPHAGDLVERSGLDIEMSSDGPAFRVETPPGKNHMLAADVWPDGADDGLVAPVISYATIAATIAYRTDDALAVRRTLAYAAGTERTLTIHVPGCEAWYVAPQAIVGLDSDGEPIRAAGGIIQNDAEQLRAVAALAAGWYGRPRRPTTYRLDTIDAVNELGPLGGMLSGVRAGGRTHETNAVIAQIRYEWGGRGDTGGFATIVTADAWQLDAVAVARGGVAVRPFDAADKDPPKRVRATGTDWRPMGVAAIMSIGSSGAYIITPHLHDPQSETAQEAARPASYIEATAYDLDYRATGAVGDVVPYWVELDASGNRMLRIDVGGAS